MCGAGDRTTRVALDAVVGALLRHHGFVISFATILPGFRADLASAINHPDKDVFVAKLAQQIFRTAQLPSIAQMDVDENRTSDNSQHIADAGDT